MILEIDAGNTLVKWRLREGNEIIQRGWSEREGILDIAADTKSQLQGIYVSSVAGLEYEQALRGSLLAQFAVDPWFARSVAACGNVSNSYRQPELMGVDRWLAMIAAYNDCGGAVCVVDAGSALTIDFVLSSGLHRGGYILPGSELMESALLKNTDRVRFDNSGEEKLEPGTSTAAAVKNGVLLSQAGAIKLALDEAQVATGDDYTLYICGGDGEKLQQLLDIEGLYRPDLVMDGLALAAAEV